MATKQKQDGEKAGVSKVQLAVGAASLFLFIVGLKRTFRVEEEREKLSGEQKRPEQRAAGGRTR